jgi:hypothetical protein
MLGIDSGYDKAKRGRQEKMASPITCTSYRKFRPRATDFESRNQYVSLQDTVEFHTYGCENVMEESCGEAEAVAGKAKRRPVQVI